MEKLEEAKRRLRRGVLGIELPALSVGGFHYSRPISGPTITVRRAGYWRGAYTRRGGVRVRRTWVPPTTYKRRDIGAPGRGPRLIRIRRPGALTRLGYSVSAPAASRRRALASAVRRYGATSVFRMLMAQATFRKRTDSLEPRFRADAEWVRSTYMGD